MLKICGKHASNLSIRRGKTHAQLSPDAPTSRHFIVQASAKTFTFHTFLKSFPSLLSTAFYRSLPLAEHNFYPVSTAPIIIFTKEKEKKGSI